MKTKLIQIALLFLISLCSCEDSLPSVAERVQKVYTAEEVTHDGTVVYSKTATSNLYPGYSNFQLNLKTAGTVSLREFSNLTFSGSYSATDNTLTLTNLSPEPTAGSTITYTITSISDDGTLLVLTAKSGNPKTGNTINVYSLVGS